MQSILDYILEGLEAELALERELGVRFVECDRSVLKVEASAPKTEAPTPKVETPTPKVETPAPKIEAPAQALPNREYDFVFLHHQELSEAGKEMMLKIIEAMGKTLETAPIVWEAPIPKAKAYVLLGSLAVKKFLPSSGGVPGQWVKSERGVDTLITYSPEYVLRFKVVSPAIKRIKQDMWLALKGVIRRIKSEE